MIWDSELYMHKHGFVAEYGTDLLQFVPDRTEQSILDIGCGIGTLTAQLQKKAKQVLGIDSSSDMIEQAKKLHPELSFCVKDALEMGFFEEWDVIFSNAVFHWIHDQKRLLEQISQALKPGGLLVCELGAAGNIAVIETVFRQILNSHGYLYTSKFCFPTSESFSSLVKNAGLQVERIYEFDRPTCLNDGERGLYYWARQFYRSELDVMPQEEQEEVLEELEKAVRDSLFNGQEWVADYRRLRVVAGKNYNCPDKI